MSNNSKLSKKQREELKKIVLARINTMPEDMNISVGDKNIDKKELSTFIKKDEEVGNQIMISELEFLQDLASGAIYTNE